MRWHGELAETVGPWNCQTVSLVARSATRTPNLRTMAVYRGLAEDGSDLEVIVTTYAGDPMGEHGERLDRGGKDWPVPGARVASRRSQVTRLDTDLDVPPVETIVVVAEGQRRGSVCLVVHRPLGTPARGSDAVARSLVLDPV